MISIYLHLTREEKRLIFAIYRLGDSIKVDLSTDTNSEL